MKLFPADLKVTPRRWPQVTALCLVAVLLFSPSVNFAIEIAPATAADIVSALGSDANGLSIHEDDLPDLFTLTSSRIDENATRFFVEQIYKEGRWKDGKAVIEYARDLSYTLVSIYDRQGRRQRLYSVKTQYAEHLARTKTHAAAGDVDEGSASGSNAEEAAAPRHEATEPGPDPSASSGGAGYEWDEEKGDYVYKGPAVSQTEVASDPRESSVSQERAASAAKSTSSSRPRRRHRRTPAPAETTVASSERSTSQSTPSGEVWLPNAGKAASTRPAKGVVVAAAGTTWVERKEVPGSSEREETPRKSKSRRHREVARAPVEEVLPVRNIDEMPEKTTVAKGSSKTSVPAEAPRKETTRETSPKAAAIEVALKPVDVDTAIEERKSSGSRRSRSRASSEEVSAPAPARSEAASTRAEPAPTAESAKAQPGGLHEEQVPSTEELLGGDDTGSTTPPPPAKSAVREPEAPPTKPMTAESDAWVPRAVKTPVVVEPVIPESKQVAMLPKKAEDPMEKLLRMSEAGKSPVNREADTWVPKTSAVGAGNEAELNREIQRVRAEERRRAVPEKKAPIKRDVNNPEEGVLPVSSFEKFSGSMYGRHREYERRFYPGKLTKSKAPQHDFYVDEVDRKKEFHNIYFYQYQKGKPPRLVAVERHDKVSFRSNYDIDKEDKGKISTYN